MSTHKTIGNIVAIDYIDYLASEVTMETKSNLPNSDR